MIKILSVGNEKCSYFNEYLKRINWKIEAKTFKANKSKLYLENIDPKDRLYLLEFGGKQYSSEQFADFLANEQEVFKSIVFVIGGAEGVPKEVRALEHKKISLGIMTWPHELARILLIEQIYRAQQILANHPYHK